MMIKKIKVVYDVDDTLWGLNDIVYGKKMRGLTINDATVFNCMDNPNLTKEQCDKIMSLYMTADTFEECEFYDGIDRIFDLEQKGKAEVWLSSANYAKEIKDVKLRRLLLEIKNINPSHIRMTVGKDHSREPGDILIDDRIENIIESDFKYYVMINKPYNTWFNIPENKNVIRVNTLNEAINIVEHIVEREML